MLIQDQAIVLCINKNTENKAIITCLTQDNGIYSGMIRNINSKKNNTIFFPGNIINFSWQARLSEHLGFISAELVKANSYIVFNNELKLLALHSCAELINNIFRERDHIDNLYEDFEQYLDSLVGQKFDLRKYILFELNLLEKGGYSLQLSHCAVTKKAQDLSHVSPRTGKAVCSEIAKEFESKLLILPKFIHGENYTIKPKDVEDSFNLTGYFFNRYIFHKDSKLYHRNKLKQRYIRNLVDAE